jgi:hypothetical protein
MNAADYSGLEFVKAEKESQAVQIERRKHDRKLWNATEHLADALGEIPFDTVMDRAIREEIRKDRERLLAEISEDFWKSEPSPKSRH